MRIKTLIAKNFRSLEDCEISFSKTYSAISGKNNAGKTNIIRAIRTVIPEQDSYYGQEDGLSFKNHFPAWKKKDAGEVHVSLTIEIDRHEDASLFEFVRKFAKSALGDEIAAVDIELTQVAKHGIAPALPSTRRNRQTFVVRQRINARIQCCKGQCRRIHSSPFVLEE